ncbi:MAG: BatA domain-containing protein [Chitinophagales bacterium]
MLELLNPYYALFGAVLLPLVVHLWNKKKAIRIKMGSVALLEEVKRNRFYNIRFSDLPLFLLRCAIVCLLAFLLMQPFWQQTVTPDKAQFAVFIHPELYPTKPYKVIENLLDSLPITQTQVHLLQTNFPELLNQAQINTEEHTTITEALKWQAANVEADVSVFDVWALMQVIDQNYCQDKSCYIFTTNQTKYYTSQKPTIAQHIETFFLPSPNDNKWIANGEWQSKNDLVLTYGVANDKGNQYKTVQLNLASKPTTIQVEELGRLNLDYQANSVTCFNQDSSLFQFIEKADNIDFKSKNKWLVLHDTDRREDARYVQAALKAINVLYKHKATIELRRNTINLSTLEQAKQIDKLFYLAAEPFNQNGKNQFASNALLVEDMVGKKATISPSTIQHVALPSEATIYQSNGTTSQLETIKQPWHNAQNKIILSQVSAKDSTMASQSHYQFHSRFHPKYTDLVTDGRLVEWIQELFVLQSAKKDNLLPLKDKRVSAEIDIQPNKYEATIQQGASFSVQHDLYLPLLCLLVILWLVERFWAESKQKKANQ